MHRSLRILLLISLLGTSAGVRATQATLDVHVTGCSYGWYDWEMSWEEVPDLCCGWLYRDNDIVARNPADSNYFAPTPAWYVFLENVSANMCLYILPNKQYAMRTEIQHPQLGWYYNQGSTNMPWVPNVRCPPVP
jgi:hypothetical protein